MSFPFTHAEVFGADPAALAEVYHAVLGWTVTRAEGVDYWRITAAPEGTANAFAGAAHASRISCRQAGCPMHGWTM